MGLNKKSFPIDLLPRSRHADLPPEVRTHALLRVVRTTGFTLIEMLIVIAIGALLLAVMVPNFGPALSRAKLNSATRDVASALRHTRGYAMIKGQDAFFELNTETHEYRVSGRQRTYHIPEEVGLSLFTTTSETVDESTGRILFFPDGSSTGGRVTLMGKNQTIVIDINWLTGEIRTGNKDVVDQ